MSERLKYQLNPRKKPYGQGVDLALLNTQIGEEVKAFHSKFASYTPTPLVCLNHLSKYLGVASIYVKDESKRFGLNAFKGLGGSFAIGKYLAQKLGRDINTLSFSELASTEVKAQIGDITFVTATDGNHGRGITWAAEQLGIKAVVYMPKGSSEIRAENIRKHGATCTITDLNYDDTVRLANQNADDKGWVLVQDTAWDGYEEIPTWIMQGYLTLIVESMTQLSETQAHPPSHIILQAGVGSFAGGIMGYLVELMKENAPIVMVVEPHKANCLYVSALTDDGQPHSVGGDMNTLMAGLACGEPNTISWPIIRDNTDCFFSADDSLSANGMRILAAPRPDSDPAIVSGESGAIGAGLLYELMTKAEHQEIKKALMLDENAHILLISTEGDTSPDIYEDIVWLGRNI